MQLVKEGDKVGASEATLLNMLNISPFTYGLVVQQVYDQGTVFSPRVLDITDEDLMKSFQDVSFFIVLVVEYIMMFIFQDLLISIIQRFASASKCCCT